MNVRTIFGGLLLAATLTGGALTTGCTDSGGNGNVGTPAGNAAQNPAASGFVQILFVNDVGSQKPVASANSLFVVDAATGVNATGPVSNCVLNGTTPDSTSGDVQSYSLVTTKDDFGNYKPNGTSAGNVINQASSGSRATAITPDGNFAYVISSVFTFPTEVVTQAPTVNSLNITAAGANTTTNSSAPIFVRKFSGTSSLAVQRVSLTPFGQQPAQFQAGTFAAPPFQLSLFGYGTAGVTTELHNVYVHPSGNFLYIMGTDTMGVANGTQDTTMVTTPPAQDQVYQNLTNIAKIPQAPPAAALNASQASTRSSGMICESRGFIDCFQINRNTGQPTFFARTLTPASSARPDWRCSKPTPRSTWICTSQYTILPLPRAALLIRVWSCNTKSTKPRAALRRCRPSRRHAGPTAWPST